VLGSRLLWIGLLLALAVGLALGLAYAWLIEPVEYYDSAPADLRPDLKKDYVRLVALSYRLTGNLELAQARLAALGSAGAPPSVAALADQMYQTGGNAETVRALALLAEALGASSQAAMAHLPTATPTLTPTPTITPTPLPTTAPTATPTPSPTATPTPKPTATPDARPPYRLLEQLQICDDPAAAGVIRVYVQDAGGEGLANVEVQVSWEGGQNRFFTGLKPEIDPGYADFEMSPGEIYEMVVWGALAGQLSTEGCPSGPAGWRLVFRKRE
jgi:hypothetical protein